MHKTLQDYDESEIEPLRGLKTELANFAEPYGLRSVRTVVNKRYDTPALRVESRYRSMNTSAQDAFDEAGVDILSAFATQEGKQVYIVGIKGGDE